MKVDAIQNEEYFRMNRIDRCIYNVCKDKKCKDKKCKQCKKHYCNPGCVGTIFHKTFKSPKGIHGKNIMLTRKVMFGKKNTVLQKNFYMRLPKKTRQTLKKKGAISGCIEW